MTDDYPTCEVTYVTLRIYHDFADPAAVTTALTLEPTDTQRLGESYERRGVTRTYRLAGWFLCSKDAVDSYDAAKHLDWLLHQIEPRMEALAAIRAEGWRPDIACLWDSHAGHGGPTLSPDLLRRLGAAGIELWFDVYFHGAYHGVEHAKRAHATRPNA